MDITLERILSLIPKKEDGKFKHGALSAFARELGFKDGHIVSDWIAGNSTSYLNYLYQISAIYNVSVEWLQGKTDEKSPTSEEIGPNKQAVLNAVENMDVPDLLELMQKVTETIQKRSNEK